MKQQNYIFQGLFRLLPMLFGLLLQTTLGTAQVGTPTYMSIAPTGTGSNNFPFNTTSSNKVQWLYGPGKFSTLGAGAGVVCPSGQLITKVYIRFSNTVNATNVLPQFTISLGQNVGTITSFGTPATTGVAFNTGLTTCFYQPSLQLTGITAGSWYGFTLQTPFPYDPSLSLVVEAKANQTSAGGNGVLTISNAGISERHYGGFAAATGTINTLTTPFGIDVIPAAVCTSPPTPGTAVAAPSTPVCSGSTVSLNLTGNSTGSGQTYQWEKSASAGGPYTSVGASQAVPALVINPTATEYYRCAVTCSGNTQTSTPVLVTVAPLFPGGNYTINSALPTGGTNYQTFTDAVAAISCGIAGPVVFDVDPGSGPYTEQITLPASIGSTAVNTVTFNGNGRKLRFNSTNSAARHVIKFDGADYITINDLYIDTLAGVANTYNWGIHMTNGADYNTISLCTINTNSSNTTSGSFQPIVLSNSTTSTTTAGNNGNYNTFIDNTLVGGYYGITLCGNATGTENLGNVVSNTTIRDFYSYGIYLLYQKSGSVSTCDISRPTRINSTTTAGVILNTGCLGMTVENCRIHNLFDGMLTNTSACYPLYDLADGTAAFPNRLINNLIYNINGEGIQYGIFNSGADYLNAYHNTIALENTASTTASVTYGFYQTTLATGIDFRNNIISIKRGGTGAKVGLYFNTTTSTIVSNNNAVHLASAGTGAQNFGNFGGTNYATLATWQTANGGIYDANSVQADPLYVSPGTGDYTPSAFQVNNIGQNMGVAYDIIGNPRSGISPDPGAFEFDLVGLDAAISWVSPVSPVSAGPNPIVVNITNNLSTTITSLDLAYTDGGTPVSETFTGLNITPFMSQQFTFAVPYNVVGNASLRAYVQLVNGIADDNQADDTTTIQNLCITLSGNYTINSASPNSLTNFQSFTALSNALSCGGVSGPVIVDVVAGSGPYNEQVNFGPIPGTSAVNTVTINGNSNTLTNAGNAGGYHTLRMGGADNMTWNNLNVATSGATNGFALIMANASDNNQFVNCTFTVPQALTATPSGAVAFTASNLAVANAGNNGNGNIFDGCTMSGGYYCVSVYGNTTVGGGIVGNQFLNCTIKDYYAYGLYHLYATNTVVRGCIFERPTRTTVTTGYGIYLSTSTLGCLFERNRIRNLFGGALTSTSTGYGIYCLSAASAGNENRIINNVVSDMRSGGALYGLYLSGPTYLQVYHNTISLDHTAATATGVCYGIYNTGATAIDIRNNIVSVSRGGTGTKYCAYYSTLPTTTNYNNFFMNAAVGANYVAFDGTTSFGTLAAYQAIQVTKDMNSVSLDPGYVDPLTGNYQPSNVALDNLGSNVGVTNDITGATRNNPPDIGAYEFEVFPVDLGVVAIVGPNNSGCYTAAEPVTVTIRNYGFNVLDFSTTPCTITCNMTGPLSGSITGSATGTLAPGSTTTVTLTGGLDMTANGTYSFNIFTTIAGDGNTNNDALSPAPSRVVGPVAGTVSSNIPQICVSGTPVLTLNGWYGGSIQWQESSVSATGPWTNVGTGATTYTPAVPVTQTSYYQAIVTCNGNTATSTTYTVVVNNPQVLSTTPGTRCGIGTVNLEATVDPGASAKWYTNPTGGTALFTGSPFTTPNINTTTTYYVEPVYGIGGADSITGPLGGTTGVYHHMFVMTSPTGMNLEAIGIRSNQALGTLTSWEVYYRPDNYQTIPGANTSSAGWTLLSTATNIPSAGTVDYTYIAFGQNLAIPPAASYSFYIAPASGTTHAYNTTALGTTVASNANAILIGGNRGSALFNCTTSGGFPTIRIKYSLGCVGTRVPVVATVTTPPSVTASAVDPVICPGGSTSISASSSNDPNYTYSWTSAPAGFTGSGAGPLTVAPTGTTTYSVYAIDNTTGPNAGCATTATVSVVTGSTLSAGTVSASQTTLCVSGSPNFTVTGASGGAIQWQESTVSASGPWTNVGTGAATYTPASPITQSSYYRVEVSCPSNSVQSNVVSITVNNPQILSTTPGSRCGYGTVTLAATADPGASIRWYDQPSGGNLLGTGSPFITPNIAATTTFYAESALGGGGVGASAIQVTELDLGGSDRLEIQNVSPDPVDVTGWKVAVSNSYTDITSVNANIQVLSGIMAPGAVMSWTDASAGPNYWGSNILWNPGAYPTYTGWAAILDNNNVLKDIVFLNWPAANIAAASITVGATVITVGTQWTGNGIDQTTVAATNSVSRQGTQDNHNASDFSIIPLSIGSSNPGMTLPFNGFACQGVPRAAVVATVNTPPAINVTASDTTLCTGESATLSVTSPNDPDYTYTWNPGNLSGASVNVSPLATTTYTLTALDNSTGPNAGCGNVATIAITVNPIQTTASASASPATICEGGNLNLSSVTLASGYTMNGNCSTTFVDISTTGTDVDLPANITDDSEHNIGIPSFTFNGVAYTTARVATNGVLVLGSASGDVTPGNGSMPSTLNTAGNVFLAPFWDDLYPTAGTNPSIKTQTIGNTFIVQWTNLSHFDNQSIGTVTFQLQMDLLNGTVTYVYSDAVFGDQLLDNAAQATVGIQFSGTSAIQYSYLTASVVNGQCISFSPNTATVSWSGPNGFSASVNNPVITGASLLAAGTYTVSAIGSNGCAATSTVNVTVNATSTSTTSVSQCAPPYVWNGNTYTASGTYTYTTLNAAGCDSVATLNLVIAPCNTTLNLTAFIQGYWDGTSAMNAVLANQFQTNPLTDCDTITVELHEASVPATILYSTQAVLQSNGTATCIFPAVSTGSYYIVIKHRNAIETWSGDSVAFSGTTVSYNFSTAASQAYGSNQIELTTGGLPNGIFALYSGDIVKDSGEATDLLDLTQLELEINNFSFGYFAEDLNGDGNVDILDAPALEGNISSFIYSNHP